MSHFRGGDVRIEFNGVDVSGDGRAVSNDSGIGSLELLSVSGSSQAVWETLDSGSSGLMVIFPEGKSIGRPTKSFTARIIGHLSATPFDDLTMPSAGFQIKGAVTGGIVA